MARLRALDARVAVFFDRGLVDARGDAEDWQVVGVEEVVAEVELVEV